MHKLHKINSGGQVLEIFSASGQQAKRMRLGDILCGFYDVDFKSGAKRFVRFFQW